MLGSAADRLALAGAPASKPSKSSSAAFKLSSFQT